MKPNAEQKAIIDQARQTLAAISTHVGATFEAASKKTNIKVRMPRGACLKITKSLPGYKAGEVGFYRGHGSLVIGGEGRPVWTNFKGSAQVVSTPSEVKLAVDNLSDRSALYVLSKSVGGLAEMMFPEPVTVTITKDADGGETDKEVGGE